MRFYIETERTHLLACDTEIMEALLNGNAAIRNLLNLNVPDHWTEFGEREFGYVKERLKESDEKNWWTYLSILKDGNVLVGSGGYHGKPDENGKVEIGYETAQEFRGRGFAQEMAKALIRHALTFPDVVTIQAHTLAEENASVSVLRKCGMEFVEEISDPEAGSVWCWQLKK